MTAADVVAYVRAHYRDATLPTDLRRLSGGLNNGVYDVGGLCVKLYKVDDRRRWEREWRALSFLAEAGLTVAPRPLWYDPDASPPAVAMELLPGEPLHDRPIGPAELTALGDTLITLFQMPETNTHPTTVIGTPAVFAEEVARTAARLGRLTRDPLARESAARLQNWLECGDLGTLAQPALPIFSRGDSNLANCLWDGRRVRFVDFEYAGLSDVAFDLGDLVEHDHAQRVPEEAWAPFLARFELDSARRRRFVAARRLAAHFWLTIFWRLTAGRPEDRIARQLRRIAHVMGLPE